jgi:DMSO/TMAO reductase YedYZ molybdopterin-dependent catalytic subunit
LNVGQLGRVNRNTDDFNQGTANNYQWTLPVIIWLFVLHPILFLLYFLSKPLGWDHGYPLRLIVPGLYAYKSAKWVSEIRLLNEDRPGTWEKQGYHRGPSVWSGERFEENRWKRKITKRG